MIQTEALTIGGIEYTRTYSDSGMLIHGGMPEDNYDEAIDLTALGRTYIETKIPANGTDADEVLAILTGESE